jgi:aspartate-semialdehyde dehydrogenase
LNLPEIAIAVVGATGAVGREILAELEERDFCQSIPPRLFASTRSAGVKIVFRGTPLTVEPFDINRFTNIDAVVMSAGGAFSKEYGEAIASRVQVVVDNSSAWRMSDKVALVVPEVNPKAIGQFPSKILANPNCSTIQLVRVLKVFQENWGLDEVVVSTYQSLSGSGQKGIDRLASQTRAWAKGEAIVAPMHETNFDNLIPAIDRISEDGHCFEEVKMVKETQKIMGLPALKVRATTIRVPVERCHAESVDVGLKQRVTRQEVLNALEKESGLLVSGSLDYESLPFASQVRSKNLVAVGRVRTPVGELSSNRVMFWNIADNLRVGAASNAVSALECFFKSKRL